MKNLKNKMVKDITNKSKTKKIVTLSLLILFTAIVSFCSVVIVYAYYSSRVYLYTSDGDKTYFKMGMELNTFFDKINSGTTTGTDIADGTSLGIACTDTSCGTLYTSGTMAASTVYYIDLDTNTSDDVHDYVYAFNSKATWGSASNPFIISAMNHLQNLYVLQNCGYFDGYYDDKSTEVTEANMPYFLVCTSIGTPVTVNGENRTYEYIGNDDHPFIGYVGGSFVDGTTTVGGKTSSQSVIYNVTSQTDSDVIDVGLFGNIGYLGDEAEIDDNGAFDGAVSTVRNLLLYDVSVKVVRKSTWQIITDFASHVFSFSKLDDDTKALASHENHHIGILAGHVEFATIEYISVYYSDENIAAIDVEFNPTAAEKNANTVANYKSVSGILGYVYCMNSEQSGGQVTLGGISNEDIEVSNSGVGTGGGGESGTGRGYVTASEIFDSYSASGELVSYTLKLQPLLELLKPQIILVC